MPPPHQEEPFVHRLQSSSASRRTASQAGFFTLIQGGERPLRPGTADKQKAPGRFVGDSGARRPSSVVVGRRRNAAKCYQPWRGWATNSPAEAGLSRALSSAPKEEGQVTSTRPAADREAYSAMRAARHGGRVTLVRGCSADRVQALGGDPWPMDHHGSPLVGNAKEDHRRTHSPVAAAPGVAHFAPSVAPLAQTKPADFVVSAAKAISGPPVLPGRLAQRVPRVRRVQRVP